MTTHQTLHQLIQQTDELAHNIHANACGIRARLRAGLLRAHVDLVNVHRNIHRFGVGLCVIANEGTMDE